MDITRESRLREVLPRRIPTCLRESRKKLERHMNKLLTKLITASILLPGLVAAEDFESYVERMIQNAKDGGGTVIIENHSSASTGGQVAGAGQTVVTDGDVSASSHTETRINAGNDGGTVQVKIETSRNGETEKKEYTKEIEPGKPVEVNVSAKVTPEGAEMETEIQGETMEASEDPVEDEVSVSARVETVLKSVPTFIKKIFSFRIRNISNF